MTEFISNNTFEPSCSCCKEPINASVAFCTNCGFPLQGMEEEKSRFIGQYIVRKNQKEEWKKQVKNAKTTLNVVGILVALAAVILSLVTANGVGSAEAITLFLVLGALAASYFFLAWWSNKNPFAAILTGFILYVSLNIFSVYNDPSSLTKGILVKGIIITYLGIGLVGASKVRSLPQQ